MINIQFNHMCYMNRNLHKQLYYCFHNIQFRNQLHISLLLRKIQQRMIDKKFLRYKWYIRLDNFHILIIMINIFHLGILFHNLHHLKCIIRNMKDNVHHDIFNNLLHIINSLHLYFRNNLNGIKKHKCFIINVILINI